MKINTINAIAYNQYNSQSLNSNTVAFSALRRRPSREEMLNQLLKNSLRIEAKCGNAKGIRESLNLGADVNYTDDPYGYKAIDLAIIYNQQDVIKELLKEDNIDLHLINKYAERQGDASCAYALAEGYPEVAKKILETMEFDINVREFYGDTALTEACYRGYDDIVEMILKRPDLEINKTSLRDSGYTFDPALHCAIEGIRYRDNSRVVKMLVARPDYNINAVDKYGNTALMYACGHKRCIMNEAWVEKVNDYDTTDSNKAIKIILERPDVDLGIKNRAGLTALDIAKIADNQDAVRMIGNAMKSKNIDFDKLSPETNIYTSKNISSYFMNLVKAKKYKDAEELLTKTHKVFLGGENNPIMEAVIKTGKSDFIEKVYDYKFNKQPKMQEEYELKLKDFLENRVKNMNFDELKDIPVVYNTPEIFKKLIDQSGFDPNYVSGGETLFEKACNADLTSELAELILSKFDNVKTDKARKMANSKIKELIDNYELGGKNIVKFENFQRGLMNKSTRENTIKEFDNFIKSKDFNPQLTDKLGNSLLHIISTVPSGESRGLIGKLLGKEVDINAQNIAGRNPLMAAIKALSIAKNETEKENLLCNIKFLLDKGANINDKDSNGQTALHYACMTTSIALLTMLLTREPNLLAKDLKGNKAFKYIQTEEMKEAYNKLVNG